MPKLFIPKTNFTSELKNYIMITIGLALYAIAWNFFMSPFKFLVGGVSGIGAIVQYTSGLPMQYTYFFINIFLILIAIKILGLKFCLKTIYAIFTLTAFLSLFQEIFSEQNALTILGPEKQLEACLVGSIFIGIGIAMCFLNNGSTGGVDIIAAIVNKYKDVSFGRAMLYVDACIITSGFFIIPTADISESLTKVFYGYINLVIVNVSLDYMVNSNRQLVQFFIFSNKYEDIAYYITRSMRRGVTLLDSVGFYSKQPGKVITTLTRANQAHELFNIVQQIDPNAIVSQTKVVDVYGKGFNKIKTKSKKLKSTEELETNHVKL
ncbi:MAG: YitT family protein [Bacteroidaceae bacterium]|nr:YitT family protein [Bacteroidaceae bacterium]